MTREERRLEVLVATSGTYAGGCLAATLSFGPFQKGVVFDGTTAVLVDDGQVQWSVHEGPFCLGTGIPTAGVATDSNV